MSNYLDSVGQFVPLLSTVAAVVLLLMGINWFLRRRWKDDANAQFRFQLIMLALTFAGFLAIIVALPITDLSLIHISEPTRLQ